MLLFPLPPGRVEGSVDGRVGVDGRLAGVAGLVEGRVGVAGLVAGRVVGRVFVRACSARE
jgi:hypothetical protein